MAIADSRPQATLPDDPSGRRLLALEVLKLAWPAMAMNALQTVNAFIDRGIIGKYLGTDALAAVGVSGQLMFLIIATAFALSTGTTALVARAFGANDMAQARRAAQQSFVLSILLGLVASGVGLALIYPYVNTMNLEPGARAATLSFLTVSAFGIAPTFVLHAIAGAFRGVGDTLRPMLIMILVNVVHLVGAVLFIIDRLPLPGGAVLDLTLFPKLGVTGAGLALVISQFVGMVLYMVVFTRFGIEGAMRLSRPDGEWVRRILRISVPASMQAFLRVSSMMAYTWIIAHTPEKTAAVAALQIGIIAEGIAFMPGLGYMVAASALVGQNLGAKQPERAEKLGWAAAWQCCALMSVLGLTFFLFAPQLAAVFSSDPEVQRIAIDYLRIMAISEPFLAFGMVLAGAHQGAGDTVRPTMITLISMWGLRVPITYVWAIVFEGGSHGAWWAMSLTQALSGVMMMVLFRMGKWKTAKV